MTAPTRPALRYHGGKWNLAPWIIQHLPAHRVYVEPFGGAASVLLRKARSYAEVYNDLDGEVVNVFRVLRDAADDLAEAVRLTPFARTEFEQSYESSNDPIEQARRTIFRSMAGFGSPAASGRLTGFRANSNRSGSTPARDWERWPEQVSAFAARLRGVVVECKRAEEVMLAHDGPDTLHYLDPPYPFGTRTPTARWDKTYRHDMSDEEHAELLELARSLRGMVVISAYPSAVYADRLDGWKRVVRSARADGAAPRTEVLWISPRAQKLELFDAAGSR